MFTGYDKDKAPTFRDSWVQLSGETAEDIAERVYDIVLENLTCLENEGDEDEDDN